MSRRLVDSVDGAGDCALLDNFGMLVQLLLAVVSFSSLLCIH